jgi:hypothetical protein
LSNDLIWIRCSAYGCGSYNILSIPIIKGHNIAINKIVEFVYKCKNTFDDALRTDMFGQKSNLEFDLYEVFMTDYEYKNNILTETYPDGIKFWALLSLLYQLYGEYLTIFKLKDTLTRLFQK